MSRRGFTLIEVLVASALLAVALGVLWQSRLSAGQAAEFIDVKTTATEDAARAVDVIARELRHASLASLSALPAASISYTSSEDADAVRTIARDTGDANQDGLGREQVVLVTPEHTRVLANTLAGGADAAPSSGLWFEPVPGGVLVTVETVARTRRGHNVPAVAQCIVRPRNP